MLARLVGNSPYNSHFHGGVWFRGGCKGCVGRIEMAAGRTREMVVVSRVFLQGFVRSFFLPLFGVSVHFLKGQKVFHLPFFSRVPVPSKINWDGVQSGGKRLEQRR